MPDIEMLREVEVEWLSGELGRAVAGLGYPVGCGVPPHPEQLKKAAKTLFDRYLRMIEMARDNAVQEVTDRQPHATMTAQEYTEMPIIGWHEVCRDVDGFGGTGVRYLGTSTMNAEHHD